MTMNREKIKGNVLIVVLFIISIIMLLPFSWIISTSLRLPQDSFKLPPSFIPTDFHYENYLMVFEGFPFARNIFNSLKIAVIVTIANVIIGSMAGYSFSRINFKGKNIIFLLILSGMMIPQQAKIIPTYLVMTNMELVGTHWSLILPVLITPLNVFFIRQFMMTIPGSYEEAAFIDGASRWRIWWSIFLPMSKSVLIMVGLLSFLASWNDFINPLIFISQYDLMTLPLGLRTLSGARNAGSISMVLAGVSISLVIPTLLYVFGQRFIAQSAAMTGVKG